MFFWGTFFPRQVYNEVQMRSFKEVGPTPNLAQGYFAVPEAVFGLRGSLACRKGLAAIPPEATRALSRGQGRTRQRVYFRSCIEFEAGAKWRE
jgi:hypothetical protein